MAWTSTVIDASLPTLFDALHGELTDLVWLDSALGGEELGGRSLFTLELAPCVSVDPHTTNYLDDDGVPQTVATSSEVWSLLDAAVVRLRRAHPGYPAGLVGVVSYEAGYLADDAIPTPSEVEPIPLLRFDLARAAVIADGTGVRVVACGATDEEAAARLRYWTDRLANVMASASTASAPARAASEPLTLLHDEDAHAHARNVEAIHDAIAAGRVYQGCLTYPLVFSRPENLASLYRVLRERSPADYAAYLRFGDLEVLSTSPERLVDISGDTALARPMKGTRKRGLAPDDVLADELQHCAKDRSENVMIVDLLRNDLGRVSVIGSVSVPQLFAIETYATVLQMTSTVQAQLLPTVGPFAALRAVFPPGSMTGAPKIEACTLLQELEGTPRGVYSGSIGWIDGGDRASFSVVIRSLQAWGDRARWHVGGGIVWESDAADEWAETRAKAATILGVAREAAQ